MSFENELMRDLEFWPLTLERWPDFEELFGIHGAYGGCWCMWWRLKRREFEKQQGEGNRLAMKSIVESGEIPGILAYLNRKAIGWCSIAPREQFASLERSPVLKRIDNCSVWSIVCLDVAKVYRDKGISMALIREAVEYVNSQGGKIVEAYPTIPRTSHLPPFSVYMGLPAIYEKAGFKVVARPSKSKLIMRYEIK